MIRIFNGVAKLDTPNTTLLLRLQGRPELVYYGGRIADAEDFSFFGFDRERGCFSSADDVDATKTVISSSGDGNNLENMIQLILGDGAATLRFSLTGAEVRERKPEFLGLPASYGESAALVLAYSDDTAGVAVEQYFGVFSDSDVIATGIRVKNTGKSAFRVRRLMSLQLDFEGADGFETVTLDGAWGRERIPHRSAVAGGSHSIASFSGMSGNTHNPFLMLNRRARRGFSVGCNLVYSGNHREIVDVSPLGRTRLLAGINDYLLNFRVKPGEEFCAPEAIFVRAEDEEKVSEEMRGFVSEHIVRGIWKKRERPVLVNSWEAMLFRFDREKLLALCDRAAEIGAELFVLDDGWFGKRDDDSCSLGDWTPNGPKLGGSLSELAEEVRRRGLQFGIWVEPEMVNRDSELFRSHPEYAMTTDGREPLEIRRQIVLDLSNPEVREVVYRKIENVISESGASYVKWDCNRGIFDLKGAEELFYRHTLAVYDLFRRLTERFPEVLFESCASGGNRFDLGMLCFTPQIWTSDNTDARARLGIQEGTLLAYPQSAMGAHVACSPSHHTFNRTSLENRFAVSAAGVFGYEFDLTTLSEEDVRLAAEQVTFYKKWRKILQFGDLYRTDSVFEGDFAGWIAVAKDKSAAVATVAALGQFDNRIPPRAHAAGLDPDALYRAEFRPQRDVPARAGFVARGDALNRGEIWLGKLFEAADLLENSNSVSTRMITFQKIS